MSSVLSNYLGNLILQEYLVGRPNWITLHNDDPTTAGDPATELLVIRQRALWSAPGSKTVANTNAMTFVQLPADLVTYMAIWDAVSGGHMLAAILLGTPIATPDSGHLLVAPGDLAITL